MKTKDAIKHFGNKAKLASAIGITRMATQQWGRYPPEGRQHQLQTLTKGKLKAEIKEK